MKRIKTILLSLFFLATSAFAQNSTWVGVFSHYLEELNPNHSRTAIWSDLHIKSKNGKLIGTFAKGYNGDTHERFQVSVEVKGKMAKIYYDKCLPRIADSKEKCTQGEFVRGDLLFKLEKSNKDGKSIYYTIWQKMFVSGKAKIVKERKYIFFVKKL